MDLFGLMPQQRDIATTLDRPLFVSAGAGTGKTFTLTQRILWALSNGSDAGGSGPYIEGLDQVLAITFTKAAAAEIRERVRGALLAAGMEEQALAVDDAWISTIHGMCSRILRAHALELGLDPEFTVLEEQAASRLMDQAVDHALERARAGVDERGRAQRSYKALFSWYVPVGRTGAGGYASGTSVRKIVRRLLELASAAPHGFDDIHLVRGSVDLDALADAYRPCLEARKTTQAYKKTAAALDAIDAFNASARTKADLLACMEACEIPSKNAAFSKEDVAALKAEAADAFVNAYLACDDAALEQLMALAREVYGDYEALKLEASALDNDDLLRRACEALRDHEGIRAEYAGRFKLVMIDEFQDTDQQQVDLIRCLVGAEGRTLCTVGDAQQSIYRFRGAEVEVFRRQQRALEAPAPAGAAPAGRLVELTRNFRSHADILEIVARIFDGEQGGLMAGFLHLDAHKGRKDALVAAGAARRQALLVAGTRKEERTLAKAQAIAERFQALADAGQPVGDMVLLLGVMTHADAYAEAIRARGLDCVIAGGSVFSQLDEVKAVRALACALADLADTAQGLAPLLQSPMFALGAQEFLALATVVDPVTGETRRRNLDAGLFSDEDAPGMGELPLLARARAVLRRALGRVGTDPFAGIARDVVNESGWFVRLAARGPEGRAAAANVLKALDALGEAEEALGNAPRQIALAFDDFLLGKEAPGALNEGGAGAVRIMTVHASKGLEFPVVAVADCCSIRANSERVQVGRQPDGSVEVAAMPARYADVRLPDGTPFDDEKLSKQFDKFLKGTGTMPAWLAPELVDDVCASDSAAGAWVALRAEDERKELEEEARKFYVACTRAREVLILALDAPVRASKDAGLAFNPKRDLTETVLRQILPGSGGVPELDADRLDFDDSHPGDYEFIVLAPCTYGEAAYESNAVIEEGRLVRAAAGEGAPVPAPGPAPAADAFNAPALDSFTLVRPAAADCRIAPAAPAPRDSYSYSSMAAALRAEGEDRAFAVARVREEDDEDGSIVITRLANGDPVALGSAFHAAAQWMVETGADSVPAARLDALARTWNCDLDQRERLDAALARWCGSAVRREALEWAEVRAEVPFFSLGADERAERFGAYAEGSIDLLCTDPARPGAALVIDYKTGGCPAETPGQLQRKHALQAEVYADALHKAGCERVSLRFVRVEIDDPQAPDQPQVVAYEL